MKNERIEEYLFVLKRLGLIEIVDNKIFIDFERNIEFLENCQNLYLEYLKKKGKLEDFQRSVSEDSDSAVIEPVAACIMGEVALARSEDFGLPLERIETRTFSQRWIEELIVVYIDLLKSTPLFEGAKAAMLTKLIKINMDKILKWLKQIEKEISKNELEDTSMF